MKEILFCLLLLISVSCHDTKEPEPENFALQSVALNGETIGISTANTERDVVFQVKFSSPVSLPSAETAIGLYKEGQKIAATYSLDKADSVVVLNINSALNGFSKYNLYIDASLVSKTNKELGAYYEYKIITEIDPSDKFERI